MRGILCMACLFGSLASAQAITSGSGDLVVVTFEVIGTAGQTSPLSLSDIAVYDSSASPITLDPPRDGTFTVE